MSVFHIHHLLRVTNEHLNDLALHSHPTYLRTLQKQADILKAANDSWFKTNESKSCWIKWDWITYFIGHVHRFGKHFDTQNQLFPPDGIHHDVLIKFAAVILVKTCLRDLLDQCERIKPDVNNIVTISTFAKTIEYISPIGEFTRILSNFAPIKFLNLVVNNIAHDEIEKESENIIKQHKYNDDEISPQLQKIITNIKLKCLHLGSK